MYFNQINKSALKMTFALFLYVTVGITAAHDDHSIEDHSMTVATDALGKVSFPISGSPEAQSRFERALALMHHMMYVQAEKEFTALANLEPNLAMAHWGIAMTQLHPLWPGQPSEDALKKGLAAVQKAKSLNPPTKREQAYIAAAETFYKDWDTVGHRERIALWETAQEKVYRANLDDTDAVAFYALSHLATASKADKDYAHQKEAGVLLDKLFAKEPEHPGVLHYTIHAYDNPMLASRGVAAARAYDKIAPEIPHSLHMPTHIFVRLGIWPDTIFWNIRSAEAALKYPAKESISHHYAHGLDYLAYAYLQGAEDKNAEDTLKKLKAKDNYQETFVSAYALAAIPARYFLERRQWAEAAALEVRSPNTFPWEKFPQLEAITYFSRGLGAARSGDSATAGQTVEILDALYKSTVNAGRPYWATLVDSQRKTVAAWAALAEGNKKQALKMMLEAAILEDSVDKHPVTPGAILPARELLGDMLALMGKHAEAIEAYETSLKISPNRFNSLYGAGRTAEIAGKLEKAKSYYSKLVQLSTKADSDRPGIKQAKMFLTKK
jgi:tetratricopeptide (TPR) repeat protein